MSQNPHSINDIAIDVQHVSKTFFATLGPQSFKESFVNIGKKMIGKQDQKIEKSDFTALEDISFSIKRGEFFGIVGRNGGGKSTLLKIIAGVYTPTKGQVAVNGKLTPFIELGVGFNPELTGKDNVYLNGALLGFNRKQMDAIYNDIVAFAELEDFMGMKLKNYSSGMQVRLAFSVAIRAETEILVVDEVLAVGDAAFQAKCFNYFYKLKKQGATVVFVSHDRGALERFCDRGVLINEGKIIEHGEISKVLGAYNAVVLEEMSGSGKSTEDGAYSSRIASSAQITRTSTYDRLGKENSKFSYRDIIKVGFEVTFKGTVSNPVLGITIWQRNLNRAIFATNTIIEDMSNTGNFKTGDKLSFVTTLPDFLNDGEYYVEPAIADESGSVVLDQLNRGATFFITGSSNPHSVLSYDGKITLSKPR